MQLLLVDQLQNLFDDLCGGKSLTEDQHISWCKYPAGIWANLSSSPGKLDGKVESQPVGHDVDMPSNSQQEAELSSSWYSTSRIFAIFWTQPWNCLHEILHQSIAPDTESHNHKTRGLQAKPLFEEVTSILPLQAAGGVKPSG